MNKVILFEFENMKDKDKATKEAVRYFKRAGAEVAQSAVSMSTKRTAGVSYREMMLTFADSQVVTLRVKQTGDIYQVLLNGAVIPIKNQDDHAKAIAEIVERLDAGRAKFQKKLAAALVKLPASIRTAAPKLREALIQKRDSLKESIASVRDEILAIRASV